MMWGLRSVCSGCCWGTEETAKKPPAAAGGFSHMFQLSRWDRTHRGTAPYANLPVFSFTPGPMVDAATQLFTY